MLQVSPVTLSSNTGAAGVQRMMGVSFPGERERERWEHEQEEAKKRDHRRIGKVRSCLKNARLYEILRCVVLILLFL